MATRPSAPPTSALFHAYFEGGDMDAPVEGLTGAKYADLGSNGKAWADPQRALVLAEVNRIREAVAKVEKTSPTTNNEAVTDIVAARANMLVASYMPILFFEKFGIRMSEVHEGPDAYVMQTPAAAAGMEVLSAQRGLALSAWWNFSAALDRFNPRKNAARRFEYAVDRRLQKYDPTKNDTSPLSNAEIRAALPAVTAAVLADKELRADVIRTLLNLKKFAGAPLPPGATPCPKCSGTGFIPAFISVEGGRCFACDGTGVKPSDESAPRSKTRRRNPVTGAFSHDEGEHRKKVVGTLDGEPVGSIIVFPSATALDKVLLREEFARFRDLPRGKVGWLGSIELPESSRNKGHGAAIVSAMLDEARALGVRSVVLHADSTESERFWSRMGFVERDTLPADVRRGLWMVPMVKVL